MKIRGEVFFKKTNSSGEISFFSGENLILNQGKIWFLWGLSAWPHHHIIFHSGENDPTTQPPDYGAIGNVSFGSSALIVEEDQTALQGGELFSFVNDSLFTGAASTLVVTKISGTDGWGLDVDLALNTYTGASDILRECGISAFDGTKHWMLARFLLGEQPINDGDDIELTWKIRLELNNG